MMALGLGDIDPLEEADNDADAATSEDPAWIGYCRIIERIGAGGMGIVYRAEQTYPLRRTVAIKIVKLGLSSEDVISRFANERRALAELNHPNIAKVHDAGTMPDGRPYFVMEYVAGEPLTSYCDKHRLSIRQRLMLFLQICDAIQHAHHRGIIHRDIKPSNVLVMEQEGNPQVKVIDFGVAKALSPSTSDALLQTEAGTPVGTREYMPPENAGGNQCAPDIRSDIYSLGVILFELICGHLPFDSHVLRSVSYLEFCRVLSSQEAPSPSKKLLTSTEGESEAAHARSTSQTALIRTLRSELEWIPLKAISKEVSKRYQTVLELDGDIRNYMNGSVLIAAPPSRAYRLRKFVRKHWKALGTACAIFTLLIALAISLSFTARFALKSKASAQQAERATLLRLANEQIQAGDRFAHIGHQDVSDPYYIKADAIYRGLGLNDCMIGWRLFLSGSSSMPIVGVDGHDRGPGGLESVAHLTSMAVASDNSFAACGARDGNIYIWDLASGNLVEQLNGGHTRPVSFIAISPNAQWILSSSFDGTVAVWDRKNGIISRRFKHADPVWAVAIASDNDTVASADESGRICLWSILSGQQIAPLAVKHRKSVSALAFSPNGQLLLSGGFDDQIMLWDVNSRSVQSVFAERSEVVSAAFDHDGLRFVDGCNDGTIHLFETQHPERNPIKLGSHGGHVWRVAFSPGGELVASGDDDHLLRCWDARTLRPMNSFEATPGEMRGVAFLFDGRIVAGASEHSLKIWNTQESVVPSVKSALVAAVSNNGIAAFGSINGDLTVVDVATRCPIHSYQISKARISSLAISEDGQAIACGTEDGTLRVLGIVPNAQNRTTSLEHGPVTAMTILKENLVLAGFGDGTLGVLNIQSGRFEAVFKGSRSVRRISHPNTSGRMLVEFEDSSMVLVDNDTFRIQVIGSFAGYKAATAYEDGQVLGFNGTDEALVLDAHGQKKSGKLPAKIDPLAVHTIADSREIATITRDGTAILMDGETLRVLGERRISDSSLQSCALAPNARYVAVCESNGTAKCWGIDAAVEKMSIAQQLRAMRDDSSGGTAAIGDKNRLVGRWFGLRGDDSWALRFLERPELTDDAAILARARCYWREGDFERAAVAFRSLRHSTSPDRYLDTCLSAVTGAPAPSNISRDVSPSSP